MTDPTSLSPRGVANQGEITSQAEASAPSTPRIDYRTNKPATSNPADVNGVCQAQIGPVSNGQTWFVEWATVQNNSTNATTLAVFKNSVDPGYLVDETTAGNANMEEPPPPGIWLGEGETLFFVWANCNAGDIGRVFAQVRVNG